MKIICKIQRRMVMGYLANDTGDFLFAICKEGFEELMDEKFKTGDIVPVIVYAKREEIG